MDKGSLYTIFLCILLCTFIFNLNYFFVTETSDGKYISPFHDIPLIVQSEQVALHQQKNITHTFSTVKNLS